MKHLTWKWWESEGVNTFYWNYSLNYIVWVVNWCCETLKHFIFHFLANICHHCKTGKTSPLRWFPFNTKLHSWKLSDSNRGACTWIIFTQNNCVPLDVCAFQYNRGSSVTAVFRSTTLHTMYPSIDLLHWSVVRICEQHNELLSYFIFVRILNHNLVFCEAIHYECTLEREKEAVVRTCVLG